MAEKGHVVFLDPILSLISSKIMHPSSAINYLLGGILLRNIVMWEVDIRNGWFKLKLI